MPGLILKQNGSWDLWQKSRDCFIYFTFMKINKASYWMRFVVCGDLITRSVGLTDSTGLLTFLGSFLIVQENKMTLTGHTQMDKFIRMTKWIFYSCLPTLHLLWMRQGVPRRYTSLKCFVFFYQTVSVVHIKYFTSLNLLGLDFLQRHFEDIERPKNTILSQLAILDHHDDAVISSE